MNYRSAVSHGVALPFTGTDEEKDAAKMHAFEKIVEASAEGRWDHARRPDAADMRGTGVVRMKVETARFDLFVVYAFVPLVDHVVLYSAKARSGPPKDDKKVSCLLILADAGVGLRVPHAP